MLNFKEKFIDTKNLDNYRLVIIHGQNEEQKQIILDSIKKYIDKIQELSIKEINDNNFILKDILITNSIFNEREFFLLDNIETKYAQNYFKIFDEYIFKTKNFFVLIYKEEIFSTLKNQFVLTINCQNFSNEDKLNYISSIIKKNKINLTDEQISLLQKKLIDQDILFINNEIEKLQIAFYNQKTISNNDIEELFDIEPITHVNSLMRGIIYKDASSINTLIKLSENYSQIFVIRVIYNYFINLSKTYLFMKINKCTFEESCKKHYGVLIDSDINKFKQHIKQYNFHRIRNILFEVVQCEIELKKHPNKSSSIFLKLFNNLVNN